ncbi:LPXTG cell wall anchor domain-containing protein [Staphylococcus sp. NRL 19/737]|nr:LPXTG cell wall anchor domain-containing protein [Staphylococcus sp. NRL 19/737]MCJ1667213.1 LPXTG cell wall anchor domain-containing protein [Staphylococcus sp. NRL 19/737]
MAMSNSGGNPDLQNFKKAVDKGDYFEIISQNKLNAGNGVYKVYKTGEVEYKNDKYSQFNKLQDGETHAEHGIAKAAEIEPQHKEESKIASVDCARELNTYYVGNVDSSEVPSTKKVNKHKSKQHDSHKSLPQTGEASHEQSSQLFGGLFLLLGSALMINRTNKKVS